jgi:glycosyltransferase involved in cell wall biosynthesis
LAVFTNDLRSALAAVQPTWDLRVCAIDRDGLTYPPGVLIVRQDIPDDYRAAARSIAASVTDLVVIQHEYGIFGGQDGSYVLEFADELRLRGVPYVLTLHTVLAQPSRSQEATLAALCRGATRVTAFTRNARTLAHETGIADPYRLVVVPHGAPAALREAVHPSEVGPGLAAALAWAGDDPLLCTFGLIGPGKGLDDAITALSGVVPHVPDVRYIIAGTTHPEVARGRGEAYREELRRIAEHCGVPKRVYLLDEFLTEPELAALLQRTDVFVTPYRSTQQACSGALTFALTAGCPVVSTAFRYAVEMLTRSADGAAPGLLVPVQSPGELGAAIVRLLRDPHALQTTGAAADALGRTLTWPRAAERFAEVYVAAAARAPAAQPSAASCGVALCLDHLDRLTDGTGIVQFSVGTRPDPRSGYCVDDMARLAIVACGLIRILPDDPRPHRWLTTALRSLERAPCVDGAHNVLAPDGTWQDGPSVGDHVGRAIWALGTVSSLPGDIGANAADPLEMMLPWLAGVSAPRTLAYAILGLTRAPLAETHRSMISNLADRVEAASLRYPGPWYEHWLTYDNARLPEAVLAAGVVCGDRDRIERALASLDWYMRQVGLAPQRTGYLRCVGNRWRDAVADGPAAGEGDEQPIDAAATVGALVGAWRATDDRTYAELAQRAFAWFHGANRAGVCVYDPMTGGCRDGLSAVGASENEGAESTLAYHQALLIMHAAGLVSVSGLGDLTARLSLA